MKSDYDINLNLTSYNSIKDIENNMIIVGTIRRLKR